MIRPFISFIFIFMLGSCTICRSQTSVFPPNPYEGMEIMYTISGAKIINEINKPGIKWTRNLVITGLHPDSVLSISGTLTSTAEDCTVTITVGAGRKSATSSYVIRKQTALNFKQQVNIPADAKSASIYINMCVLISPSQEARELVFLAVWDGKWAK